MTAYYNAPDDKRDLTAHFHTAAEAIEYADKYGGTVEQSGVVFTVGRDSDHDKAREDARAAGELSAAPAPAALTQADVDKAVAAALAKADKAAAKADKADDAGDGK